MDPFPSFPLHHLQLLCPLLPGPTFTGLGPSCTPFSSRQVSSALLEDALPATHTAGITLQVCATMVPLGSQSVSRSSLAYRPRADAAVNCQEQGPFRVGLSCQGLSTPGESLDFADWPLRPCLVVWEPKETPSGTKCVPGSLGGKVLDHPICSPGKGVLCFLWCFAVCGGGVGQADAWTAAAHLLCARPPCGWCIHHFAHLTFAAALWHRQVLLSVLVFQECWA